MAIAQWKKIDFHTHTPASNDFKNRDQVTPEQWIEAASSAGLDAVVVTDHNSVEWVSKLREVVQEDLFIYPGIEICYGDAFIHLILIIDPELEEEAIKDMIVELGLPKSDWGNTEKNVDEAHLLSFMMKYADKVMLVPAHFGTTKGIANSISQSGVKSFFEKFNVNAIEARNDKDFEEMNKKLVAGCFTQLAVVTGSDNPDPSSEKHSIRGFGKTYSSIKVGKFTLESLRQAFLDYESRIELIIEGDAKEHEYYINHNYIAGIKIKNLKHVNELNFRLSPNLNCIVGGRGTGKSTIIEMIKYNLESVNYAQVNDLDDGILKTRTSTTDIDLYYEFGGNTSYLINQSYDGSKSEIIVKDDSGTITEFPKFEANIYSQKELFNMVDNDDDVLYNAQSPLISIIDESINGTIAEYTNEINDVKREMQDISQSIKNNRIRLVRKSTLVAELRVLESKISNIRQSGIIDIRNEIKQAEKPINEVTDRVNNFYQDISNNLSNALKTTNLFSDLLVKNGLSFADDLNMLLNQLDTSLCSVFDELDNKREEFLNIITLSNETEALNSKRELYNNLKEDLDETVLKRIEETESEIKIKKEELHKLNQIEVDYNIGLERYNKLVEEYFNLHDKLTEKRQEKINELNEQVDNIRLSIHTMSHKDRWLYNIRKNLSKEEVFDKDFIKLRDYLFDDIELIKEKYVEWLKFVLLENDITSFEGFNEPNDQRFLSIWRDRIEGNTLSSLINVEVEDRIDISIVDEGAEIAINEGSPGQKTAAMLAFILHQGDAPIIIDQPEDDLDNSLIIDLIVKSIRKLKKNRQIIIATHNANIPVLGDAEGIIILERNTEGKVDFRRGKKTGCLEEKVIKNGICDIMEGGITAFKLREQKYKYVVDYL